MLSSHLVHIFFRFKKLPEFYIVLTHINEEEGRRMDIYYASKTHNIKRFLRKYAQTYDVHRVFTHIPNTPHQNIPVPTKPFVLFTYTTGFGETPPEVTLFLTHEHTRHLCQGIVGSGNKNWGTVYCKAAYDLANMLDVPLLATFELSGTSKDIERVHTALQTLSSEQQM